jgi:hypothetical protein
MATKTAKKSAVEGRSAGADGVRSGVGQVRFDHVPVRNAAGKIVKWTRYFKGCAPEGSEVYSAPRIRRRRSRTA